MVQGSFANSPNIMGFSNLQAMKKRHKDAELLNPCFTGDMKLLTKDGYKAFKELSGNEVDVVSYDGSISVGKVWETGIKEIVQLTFSDGTIIKCTPNHVFMHIDGSEIEAKDSLGKRIKSFSKESDGCVVVDIIGAGKEMVYDFSEPNNHWGVVNGFVAHNCGEILILDEKGLCNLTTVNMLSFVDKDGSYDREAMLNAQKLSARAGYRVTCLDLELPEWDFNQKKHRSLGCSLSGIQDFINATNISKEDMAKLYEDLRDVAVLEGEKYAKEVGGNKPSLVTTIKPAGSSSQLFGESSGVHYSHSPYFIRRVRVSVNDPLLKVAEEIGLNINNEVGQSEELGNLKTKVVDFYCKSPEGKTKYEATAIEQLEFYKFTMKHYIDHNVSITVHVREHEWEGVEQWLWYNWDEVIAISFMSLDDSFYQLLPYEAITKEQYEQKKHLMQENFTAEIIQRYEKVEYKIDEDELDADCSSGVCKLR